jgi:hypothetical protein
MNKITNVVVILGIAILLIFVSGQQGCQQEEETEFESAGLNMNFVADAPPEEVNYGQDFPIYVDIQNNGGSDIDVGRALFYLSGVGANLNGVETFKTNSVRLTKKTPTQEGASERLKFAEAATPAVQLQNPYSFNLQLDSCYDYAAITETTLCVGKSSGVCDIEGNKIESGTNTGGPIQVTSLTERISGNKLYFDFVISNNGNGKVYLHDSDCDKLQENDLDEKQKENMVGVVIRTEEGFSCNIQQATFPYGTIDALQGAAKVGKITCVKSLDGAETHSAAAEITLTYKYRENLIKGLTILPA